MQWERNKKMPNSSVFIDHPDEEYDINIQPYIFWESLISFISSFYVVIFLIDDKTSTDVFIFEVFCFVYVVRIYLGLLMTTYDRSIRKTMNSATRLMSDLLSTSTSYVGSVFAMNGMWIQIH